MFLKLLIKVQGIQWVTFQTEGIFVGWTENIRTMSASSSVSDDQVTLSTKSIPWLQLETLIVIIYLSPVATLFVPCNPNQPCIILFIG